MLWFDLAVLEYKYGSKTMAKSALEQALSYDQEKDPNIEFINYIFSHNKPLLVQVTNGAVSFYTTK